MMFLQGLALTDTDFMAALVGLFVAFAFFAIILLIGLYIYLSFAYSAIARRTKVKPASIAWIPILGPLIIAYKTSKMHWWPWLLLILFFVPVVNFVFFVFTVVWHWKMFVALKRPGWFAILQLIPVVGLVIIGISAWGKN